MVARKQWTREWWDTKAAKHYSLVTSVAVLEEIESGDFPNKDKVSELMRDVPLIPVEPAIAEIVQVYVRHRLMPSDPVGDALHLALASYHKCEFLLTWNCRHLANANKFAHIRRINTMLGLYVPSLVTPLELLGETK